MDEATRTQRVREALGPTPTAADAEALRAARDRVKEALDALGRVQTTVSPRRVVDDRAGGALALALRHLDAELRGVERALEPLAVGQTVQVVCQSGPNGVVTVDACFLGVDDDGFILLRPPPGRRRTLTEHRMPRGGPYGLHYEERHRVETWIAAQRAAGLPTAPARGARRAPRQVAS